jgi:hypothetical protein
MVWYILFFISWQFERCGIFCFSFDDSSNGVVYFVFHLMTFRTVWYILFFIWWQFNKIYHTVRIDIKWKTKYNTPFELSSNEKQNIPHRSKCYKMKIIPVRTVWYILFFILWHFERCGIFCFSFYDCSNGVVYFIFIFIAVRTVWNKI